MSTPEAKPTLHNFRVFYRGKHIDIQAKSTYDAQQKGALHFKAKKAWECHIVPLDFPIDPASL